MYFLKVLIFLISIGLYSCNGESPSEETGEEGANNPVGQNPNDPDPNIPEEDPKIPEEDPNNPDKAGNNDPVDDPAVPPTTNKTLNIQTGALTIGNTDMVAQAYELKTDGTRGKLLNTGSVSNEGLANVMVPVGTLAIEVAVVPSSLGLNTNDSQGIRTRIADISNTTAIAVNAATEMMVTRSDILKNDYDNFQEAWERSKIEISATTGVEDILSPPAKLDTSVEDASDSARYKLFLDGLKKKSDSLSVSLETYYSILKQDFKDGFLTGTDDGHPLDVDGKFLYDKSFETDITASMKEVVSNQSGMKLSYNSIGSLSGSPVYAHQFKDVSELDTYEITLPTLYDKWLEWRLGTGASKYFEDFNTCYGPYYVYSVDKNGQPLNAVEDLTITIYGSANSSGLYTTNDCTGSTATELTISTGNNASEAVYWKTGNANLALTAYVSNPMDSGYQQDFFYPIGVYYETPQSLPKRLAWLFDLHTIHSEDVDKFPFGGYRSWGDYSKPIPRETCWPVVTSLSAGGAPSYGVLPSNFSPSYVQNSALQTPSGSTHEARDLQIFTTLAGCQSAEQAIEVDGGFDPAASKSITSTVLAGETHSISYIYIPLCYTGGYTDADEFSLSVVNNWTNAMTRGDSYKFYAEDLTPAEATTCGY